MYNVYVCYIYNYKGNFIDILHYVVGDKRFELLKAYNY